MGQKKIVILANQCQVGSALSADGLRPVARRYSTSRGGRVQKLSAFALAAARKEVLMTL